MMSPGVQFRQPAGHLPAAHRFLVAGVAGQGRVCVGAGEGDGGS